MKAERLSVLLLLSVIAVSIFSAVSAIAVESGRERAENFLEMAYDAQEKANDTLAIGQTKVNATIFAMAIANFTEGAEHLEEANAIFNGTLAPPINYTGVTELAQMAMHDFRYSMSLIMRNWNDTSVAMGWRGLIGVIEELEEHLGGMNITVQNATSYATFNLAKLESMMNDTRLHLNWARNNITAFNISAATHEIGRARSILNDLAGDMKRIGESLEVKGKRITNFIEHPLNKSIERLRDSAEGEGRDIVSEMHELDSIIREARRLAEEGNLKGAMEHLKDAHRNLGDLMKEMHKGPKGNH